MARQKKWWSISEASKYSGLPATMLRRQMVAKAEGRNGADIGIAVRGSGERWTFYIFPEKFKAWLGEGVFVPDKYVPELSHQVYPR